jgi:hypothetical protein
LPLNSEPTSQSLDKKLLIMGFEVPDVLGIFLLLSVLNFAFGGTDHKLLLIWLPVVTAGLVLRIGKKDKPDNYLVHLVKFKIRKKHLSAFTEPSRDRTYLPKKA